MAQNEMRVSLAFTANTNEAIQQVKRLQKELNELATGKSVLKGSGISQLTPEIQKAMVAAGELQAKLEGAVNLKTGKLDLGVFSDSLKKSGVTLQEYASKLNALGPQGRQAFQSLAQSIIQAEAPLIRCNQKLKEFGVSLANTARWQISSSILHGFIGSVQSAYGYVKNLNASLNDIRIVTGASVEEMAAFADKANKAARALSTTTNEYAKASLIYFQQGLSDEEVAKRTEVTVKMANAAGKTAEVVSDQLTAVWNNFYDGSKSLEHYADVMTALGAATASSTDEIAGGLEKFAAVAETIGLSYEYAASALATITSNTRQSEEVVGTALRTIFARIQGLKLGEVLDDGTTLNKYSEALDKVGISIFDQSGEIKNMDNILDEMADKWVKLNKDQQLALAQTVAGTRQYNQLISLMDNWDAGDSDSMVANLETAANSSGELQKQADIYAESWEAARDRVTASAEAVYEKILDDDFFIDFLGGLENAIDGVGNLIDALGGLKGVLFTIGSVVTAVFQKEISKSLHNAAYTLKQFTGIGKKSDEETKQEAIRSMQNLQSGNTRSSGKAENASLEREISMQFALNNAAKKLTDEDLKQLQIQMDLVRAMDKRAVEAAKNLEIAEDELNVLQQQNRLRVKADAQKEARDRGKVEFGKELMSTERPNLNNPQAEAVVGRAGAQAIDVVANKYGLETSDQNLLSQYQDEIALELVNQLKDSIDIFSEGDFDKEELVNFFNSKLKEHIESIFSQEDIEKKGKEVDKYQSQIKKSGAVYAQGENLSKLATTLTTKTSSGEFKNGEELSNVYKQLSERVAEAKKKVIELKKEIGEDDADAAMTVDKMENAIDEFSKSLEGAKNDASALQGVLDELSLGETLQTLSLDLGSEQGQFVERMTDAVGQPSFDTKGQFEAATEEERRRIKYKNYKKDVEGQKEEFDGFVDKKGAGGILDWADQISNTSNVIMNLGSAITSVQGIINVFMNPDASAWQKISSILMNLPTVIPLITSAMKIFGNTGQSVGQKLMASFGPIGLAIMGIVTAITAGIAVVSIIKENTVSAEEKTERLTQAVDDLKSATSEAKSTAEGLKSAFDDYNSVYDTLKECTVGTTEWKTAMEDVRNSIDGILETYPELKKVKDIVKWDDATQSYILDTDKVEEYVENAEKAAASLEYGTSMAESRVAQNKADRYVSDFETTKADFSKLNINIDELTDSERNNYDLLYERIKSSLEGTESWTQEDWQAWEDYQRSTIEDMAEMAASYHTLNNEASAIAENSSKIAAQNLYADQGRSQAEINAAAIIQQKTENDLYETYYGKDGSDGELAKEFSKIDKHYSALNSEQKDLLSRYEQAIGKTIEWDENLVRGSDANRTFHAKDDEEGISVEEMVSAIAAYDALYNSDQEGAMDQVSEAMKSANDLGDKLILAISEGGTEESLSNFFSQLTKDELADFKNMFNEDGGLNEEVLTQLGLDAKTVTDIFELLGIELTIFSENVQKAGSNVTHFTTEQQGMLEVSKVNLTGTSIQQQKDFANAKLSAGKNMLGDISNDITFGEMESQNTNNVEGLTKFYEGLSEIDLHSEDAAEQIQQLADEYGVQGSEVQDLITEVQGLDKTYNVSTTDIQQQAAKLKEIVGDGLEVGDILNEEQITVLKEAGINVDEYFSQMSDGTYSLTGKAEEFNKVVNDIPFDALKEKLDKFTQSDKQYGGYTVSELRDLNRAGGADFQRERLNYIESLGGEAAFNFSDDMNELLRAYKEDSSISFDADDLYEITEAFKVIAEEETKVQQQTLATATSFDELNTKLLQIGTVSLDTYSNSLINLASNYENCKKEIVEYQNALESEDEKLIQEKTLQLENAVQIAETIDLYDLEAEAVEEVSKGFLKMAESENEAYNLLEEDSEALSDASIRYVRLNNAILDLSENYEDYKQILKDLQNASDELDKSNIASQNSFKSLQKSIAGLLGTSEDLIDVDLISAIDPNDFKEAASGSEAAIERIRDAFIKLQIEGIDGIDFNSIKEELASLEEGIVFDIDADTNSFLYKLLQAKVEAGASATEIESLLEGLDIDADVQPLTEDLAAAVAAADEASTAIIESMSISQDVEAVQVDQPVKNEETEVQTVWTPKRINRGSIVLKDGQDRPQVIGESRTNWQKEIKSNIISNEEIKSTGAISTTAKNAKGKSGPKKGVVIKNAHKSVGSSVGSSTASTAKRNLNTGSSGSTKSPDDYKKDSMVERYKEINDALDDTSQRLEKASDEADRLWGSARIAAMKKSNKELKEEISLLKEKRSQINTYLRTDKTALNSAAKKVGVKFTYDEDGDITNYTKEVLALEKRRESLIAGFGSSIDESEQKEIEKLEDNIEEFEKAYKKYEDTKKERDENEKNIREKENEEREKNYEIFTQKIEYKIDVDDRELTELDFKLKVIEDDFFSMGEAMALLGDKMETSFNSLETYGQSQAEIDKLLEKGKIDPADWAEYTKQNYENIYSKLSDLVEHDKEMMEYYGNALDKANEEISKYTDRMEHQTEVLEHYQSVMEIMGKSTDYKKMGTILKGQSKTLKDQVAVAEKTMKMFKDQEDDWKKKYEKALKSGNKEQIEYYKTQYEEAIKHSTEAEENYLSKVENYAESVKAVFENTLSEFGQDLENALTGGTSFDQINSNLERAASIQEEYLTTTNQIYETNKLMRSAQQEIDKTNNTIAKNRLKEFITQTNQMQNQNKLSQFELDIQQAKYDLLLAEIALEEAQNAKSMVRLQRDSEGNFGYVYTADSEKTSQAEQAVADAENKLYNIQLDGANSYTEKYQQTMSEMYDTLTDLQTQYLEGAFESEEEYHNAVDQATKYYYDKLGQYSSLHAVAIAEDNRVVEDAWSTQFNSMIYNTENWKDSVEEYVDNVEKAFKDFGSEMKNIEKDLGLNKIEKSVSNITKESSKLKTELTKKDGVLDAVEKEIKQVNKSATAYGKKRKEIVDTAKAYQSLATQIKNTLKQKSKLDETKDDDKEKNKDDKTKNKNQNNNKDNNNNNDSNSSNGSKSHNATTKRGVALAIWNGGYGWGTGETRKDRLKEKGFDPSEIQSLVNNTNVAGSWQSRYGISDLSKYSYQSFDTGGYTGAWGPTGKLAFLHEKEIVLDKKDTENFLKGIHALRDISQNGAYGKFLSTYEEKKNNVIENFMTKNNSLNTDLLDYIIKSIDLFTANNFIASELRTPGLNNEINKTLDQKVEITATFPNVTSHNEIEEAFENLRNRASQYANRD